MFLENPSTAGFIGRKISPDLTRKSWTPPKSMADTWISRRAARQLASFNHRSSYLDINRIWVGTDDGLIKRRPMEQDLGM